MTGPALAPVVESVFPRSLRECAARAGWFSCVLAGAAAFLFPSSAHAGTEVPEARWTTAAGLAVGGLLLRFAGGRAAGAIAAVAVFAAAGAIAGTGWLFLHAGLVALWLATSLVPRGAPPAAEHEPEPHAVHELVESVATALVLALVVREFGFEAFKIPTGSMEPTILGDGPGRRGDRILAFKPGAFRRWDIVVFRFPLFRNTNYIKRLVGLPGEHVEIRDGDIYADGVIQPKPDDVQGVMWRAALETKSAEEWVDRFEPDAAGVWLLRKGFAEADDAKGGRASLAWCWLMEGFREDLRVTADVEVRSLGEGAEVALAAEGGRRRCHLVVTRDGATITGPGGSWTTDAVSLARLGTSFRLGFSATDRICRIFVGGRQVASWRHEDRTNDGSDGGRAGIGVRNASVVVRRVAVENDLQYVRTGTSTWDVPADGYVMLGDNTSSSRDSRYWAANVVRLKDGRSFVAPDYARVTEDREESVFRVRTDGGVEMTDSYGIRRSFAKDEIESIERNKSLPFAWRDDLVGRAFLTFFPFPPAGDFRPRLLR